MKCFRWMLVLTAVFWLCAPAQAQTIADAARKERARRKELQTKTIFTNSGTPAAPAKVEPGRQGTTTAAAAEAPKGPVDNKGRDEKYWRDTFAKARAELKRAQDKQTVLDARLTDLNAQLLREGVYTREVELRAQIDTTQKEQGANRAEVTALEQKLRDLEDDLIRSGGLPGWAR
jgi:hypothetical protein